MDIWDNRETDDHGVSVVNGISDYSTTAQYKRLAKSMGIRADLGGHRAERFDFGDMFKRTAS